VPASVLQTVNFLVSFGVITTMFMLVYKMVPDAYVAWGDAFVGAMVTALLFNAGGQAISAFLGKSVGSSVYGTAGSVLALLLWVYYSAQVFFFGAEVTRIFAERCGAGIIPTRHSLRTVVRRNNDAH
jgi:membrane protein